MKTITLGRLNLTVMEQVNPYPLALLADTPPVLVLRDCAATRWWSPRTPDGGLRATLHSNPNCKRVYRRGHTSTMVPRDPSPDVLALLTICKVCSGEWFANRPRGPRTRFTLGAGSAATCAPARAGAS